MSRFVFISAILAICFATILEAKQFSNCEFAKTIKSMGIPRSQIATWTCIAKHESNFKTDAINRQTGDHGILQISEKWWCSNTNTPGKACKTTCAKFRDNNIRDDVACARKIYAEHQRLSGNGFNAWVAYKRYCRGNNDNYISGCKI